MLFAFVFRMFFPKKKKHISDTDLPPKRTPKPIMLYVDNKTKDKKKVVLFGNDRFLLEKNHGSDEGVTVNSSASTVNYIEILQGLAHEPTEFNLIRFRTTNNEQFKQLVEVCYKHMSGQMMTDPIYLFSHAIPAKVLLENTGLTVEQFTEKFGHHPEKPTIIDVPYNIEIGGNVYFEFDVLPETYIQITLFAGQKLPPLTLPKPVKKSIFFRTIRETISIASWVGGIAYIYFNYFNA